MNKLLLILGGGVNQIPIVKAAKELGIDTLVVDSTINESCKEITDRFEKADITDKHIILELARKHKIDAILADQLDLAVPTAAYVAENMGLKGISYETALKFTNKFLMRENLKSLLSSNIPSYHFFDDLNAALDFARNTHRINSYLVKPINSQGSRGVYRLQSDNFSETISSAFLESHKRGVLIEEFISGYEYSVEAYTENNTVHNLAVTKKYHYDHNPCLDRQNTWINDVSQELETELFKLNEKVIRSLGLTFGITHAEFKMSDGKPFLIEIAARGGGGSISNKVIPYLTGFIPVKALICYLLDIPHKVEVENYKRRFASLKFFNFKPGKVKKIHINKKLLEDLIDFQLDLKEGEIIKPVVDSRDRHGYFIVSADNRQSLLDKEKWVLESVIIEYET